jgi:ATP-dependent exoDNAse (exonuclease V) alpha subunit
VRASRIAAACAEQKTVREIMVFLHSHGVGSARAVRIYKTYGADAVQVMSENPYRLARDIRGIGFKTADAIAMKLGIDKTAMIRVRAGISYALTEAMDDGHCGLPAAELTPLGEKLLDALVKAIPDKGALLIVGDVDQLSSVGPGQLLADVIASGAVPVVRLTEVFRQAAESRIIVNAHRIPRCHTGLSQTGSGERLLFCRGRGSGDRSPSHHRAVKTGIPRRFELDSIRDVQVLCPMNRGGVGARSLNIELPAALNPSGERKVVRFGWTFAPGDKVMQVENDYDKGSTTATSGT